MTMRRGGWIERKDGVSMAQAMTGSGEFYATLTAFTEFARVGEADAFQPLPDDWVLLAADIVRSRDALAEGRYKTVNMIAASVVAAVLNAAGRAELPFVFGGDGALAAVPPQHAEKASRALAGVRAMAKAVCGLDLRVAAIPVADIRALGHDLRVAKFELSPGNNLAMFSGGGIECGEAILKDPQRIIPYRIAETKARDAADLDGLSCRWEPLPAEHGCMVTLLLRPRDGRPEELRAVLADLDGALGFDLAARSPKVAPARRSNLRFRFPPSGLMAEVRMVGWGRGMARTLLRGLAASVAFVYATASGRRLGSFDASSYLDDVVVNTDFRKFDDTLRLVLDVTGAQVSALAAYLDEASREGRIAYGMHVSDAALMTCLVFGLDRSSHVHFVDGNDGGFTRAALDLEARLEREKGQA
jgi:hypothetical protein